MPLPPSSSANTSTPAAKHPLVLDGATADFYVNSLVAERFFAPLWEQLANARNRRECRELSDREWFVLGIRRALTAHGSGRAFLQHLLANGWAAPTLSHFFESYKSQRRLALVAEVSQAIARLDQAEVTAAADPLTGAVELAHYDLYAGDGHFHQAAAHDPRDAETGKKYATGHCFALNLRTQALSHLTVADQAERKHEHDLRALKRLAIDTLRQHAPQGRRVLYVWDRAGVDFRQWHAWKQRWGIYFLSRQKDNMRLEVIGQNPWERADPRNQGVLADELVATSQGVSVRRIIYRCPVSAEEYHYLTNVNDVPPGLIAHLYRARWEIEKVFDELKNKLEEGRAWASSATAKTMQAQFLCLAHNLMLLCEDWLAREHGISNQAEHDRRTQRLQEVDKRLARQTQTTPVLISGHQRLTVRSVKFIRWLRVQLFESLHHAQPLAILATLYASL
jgi:hypothetical protein